MPTTPKQRRPVVLPHPADVPLALLRRHIGLPPDETLSEPVQSLIDRTRRCFEDYPSPWTANREVAIESVKADSILLSGGERWTSQLLASGFKQAKVDSVVVFAATVGGEVDDAVGQRWAKDRPDEAMFQSAFAIAFLEHLRDVAAGQLAARAKTRQMTLLPRFSPGYDGWNLADQASLFRLIAETPEFQTCPAPPLVLLDSFGLSPTNSTLAVYGLSRRADLADALEGYWQHVRKRMVDEPSAQRRDDDDVGPPIYAFPEKALRKWSADRLTIHFEPDERLIATFRFDGSSCTNMGIPHAFDLTVELRADRTRGYRVEACRCRKAEGDRGHRATCGFLDRPDAFLKDISEFSQPVGKMLDDVLQWSPEVNHAGCLCLAANQNHKWLMALQTLHFALNGESDG